MIKVNEPEKVGKGLTKQDMTLQMPMKMLFRHSGGLDVNKVKLAESYDCDN